METIAELEDFRVRELLEKESYVVVHFPGQKHRASGLVDLLLTITACAGAASAAVFFTDAIGLTHRVGADQHMIMSVIGFILCALSLPMILYMSVRCGRSVVLLVGALIVFTIVLLTTVT
ncbi:MAG: hypothetical protein ACRD3W_31855 [Terriglobales bacterium]